MRVSLRPCKRCNLLKGRESHIICVVFNGRRSNACAAARVILYLQFEVSLSSDGWVISKSSLQPHIVSTNLRCVYRVHFHFKDETLNISGSVNRFCLCKSNHVLVMLKPCTPQILQFVVKKAIRNIYCEFLQYYGYRRVAVVVQDVVLVNRGDGS